MGELRPEMRAVAWRTRPVQCISFWRVSPLGGRSMMTLPGRSMCSASTMMFAADHQREADIGPHLVKMLEPLGRHARGIGEPFGDGGFDQPVARSGAPQGSFQGAEQIDGPWQELRTTALAAPRAGRVSDA